MYSFPLQTNLNPVSRYSQKSWLATFESQDSGDNGLLFFLFCQLMSLIRVTNRNMGEVGKGLRGTMGRDSQKQEPFEGRLET